METAISVSLGPMGSLLNKFDDLLGSESRLWKELKDAMKLLRIDLERIITFLENLSNVEDPNLVVMCWMKQVRELCYDMDDYVDKLNHPRTWKMFRRKSKITRLKISPLVKKQQMMRRRPRIANLISGFRASVLRAIQQHEIYGLYKTDDGCVRADILIGEDTSRDGVEANRLVGIDASIDHLIKQLTNDEEQELKVISVLGHGGVGKTTLVKEMYRTLGGQFECSVFVRVSRSTDLRRLFRSMLQQVCQRQSTDHCEVQDFIDDLRGHLQGKRYLVIIDDIWTTAVWGILTRAFPEGNCSSRIITTTEIEDVALACCSYQSELIFRMNPLSEEESYHLFDTILGSANNCPEQLKQEILKRCGRLPLAITSIASLLASQPIIANQPVERLFERYSYVCNSLSSRMRIDPIMEGVRLMLNFSYNNLPQILKTCLLYLYIYPENYTIRKDEVVKQWVAEGFVTGMEGEDIEDVAGRYVDVLVNMSMIQPIVTSNRDEVSHYVVHSMVLDLIAYKSIEENFVTVLDNSQTILRHTDKIRRLSIHFGDANYGRTLSNVIASHVRSLFYFGTFKGLPPILEFKILRVLVLQFWDDFEGTSLNISSICNLFQLRYLKIESNVIVQLPSEIQGLHNLKYFDLSSRSMENTRSLGKVDGLLDLVLTCSAMLAGHLERHIDNLPASLQRLELSPPIGIFSRLPKWIGQLNKLRVLKIEVRKLLMEDIVILETLHNLSSLSLYVRTSQERRIVFYKMVFPVLKYFTFMCDVPCLIFEERAMPNLQKLNMGFNVHRLEQCIPIHAGIEHLLNLKEISAQIGWLGAEESDKKAAERAVKDAINNHPSRPSYNLYWVDQIFDDEHITRTDKEHGSLEAIKQISRKGQGGNIQRDEETDEQQDVDTKTDSRISYGRHTASSLKTESASSSWHLQSTEEATPRALPAQGDGLKILLSSDEPLENVLHDTSVGAGDAEPVLVASDNIDPTDMAGANADSKTECDRPEEEDVDISLVELRETSLQKENQRLEAYVAELDVVNDELKHRVSVNTVETKMYELKMSSLQKENQMLEAQLEAVKAKLKLLKAKVNRDQEEARRETAALLERVEKLHSDSDDRVSALAAEVAALRKENAGLEEENMGLALRLRKAEEAAASPNLVLQGTSVGSGDAEPALVARVKIGPADIAGANAHGETDQHDRSEEEEHEEDVERLKERTSLVEREGNLEELELLELYRLMEQEAPIREDNQKLQAHVIRQEAVVEEANYPRETSESLTRQFEQLRSDNYAHVEELVYLKWVNSCLRHELRVHNSASSVHEEHDDGTLSAMDLSTSMSYRSSEKAKQLMRRYGNPGPVGGFDPAPVSTLHDSRDGNDDSEHDPERSPDPDTSMAKRKAAAATRWKQKTMEEDKNHSSLNWLK